MSAVGVRWAVAAAVAWWVSGAAADSWSSIGDNLRAGMAGVLEMAAVNYSEPNINVTYTARLDFDMRAMGALYNATPAVLDAIFHKQAYPEGIVTVSDGHLEIYSPLMDKWRPLAAHYAGPLAALACAALLAVALPTAGLFWCCCYWCRGGQRRRPFDRKYDACLKGVLAILLIALLTLFLFGVVCAFASDSQVEEGLQEAPAAVRGGARDVRAFLHATAAHARHLLVTNYRELERKLHSILDSSGLTISVQLGEFTRAVSVTTLASMVRELDAVQADLQQVTRATAALRTQAERLNAALRSVKGQLLRTLAQCEQPQCRQLQEKHRIGQLDTEIQYSQMPDVTELLNNVTELLESDIKKEVEEGSKVFREIQREVQRSVDEHLPSVNKEITNIGVRLSAMADEITWQAGNASEAVQRGQVEVTDTMRDILHRWGPYRRYLGLGTATALLAVVVVLAWGLTCGVCGKRPDVYGASECCNKGAGSKCLLCGTMLMFLVGGAACLVLMVYLAAGGVLQRAACDPLTEPDGNRLFSDLERVVDLERLLFNERRDPDFNMTYVLHHCHRNQTVYQVFQLHRLYDLQQIKDELSSAVERRVASLRPQFGRQKVQILAPSAKVKLRKLADTGLSEFDFDRILYALETNMTSLALDALSSQLESAATALAERAGFRDVALQLRQAADRLQRTDADIVRPMLQHTHQLNETAMRLRDVLRFNHSSLKEAVSYLMHETAQAEVFLNAQGPALIQNMTREFAEVVAGLLEQYLVRVAAAAQHEVGRCGPLSNAFNATRDAHCRKLLVPANGYWISLAWCVALLVPLMVVAQRLARLYLHLDPYPGPLVEAEYLYDAYADRDNVPLANGSKRSTLDIEGKIAEWRRAAPSAPSAPEEPPGAGDGAAPDGAAGTHVLLDGAEVVCRLVPPAAAAALMDDLKTRLDAKDEDNESGIHDADAYKAEKRSGREGRRGAGGPAGSEARGARAADPAPAADAHARRYNDMAPKHWEEGPPRYHGPTEYERPPPYYYPGPADRQ